MRNPLQHIQFKCNKSARGRCKQQARALSTQERLAAVEESGLITRIINAWWDRLIGAVYSGSLADQTARYAAHDTKRDYLLNSLGQGVSGVLFPLLTILATQLAGAEQAGMFSMAFVIANLLQFIGMYGTRTYQVSDIDEMDSFGAYQLHRFLVCLLMLGAGWLYCAARGYSGEMLAICWGSFIFRAMDALADVYEGRLQQLDKLYLAGVSQAMRSILAIFIFALVLLISRSLSFATLGLALAGIASFVLLTLPLALFETPRSRSMTFTELRELFVECFPAFLAQFLFALIETLPKLAMEGSLPYDRQLYFNAIYFPAQAILVVVALVYRPQLVRLASIWADVRRRRRFDLIILAMLILTAVYTLLCLVFQALIGIKLNTLLYGLDFEPYRKQQYLMIIAGGMSAAIDFLYQVITVLRQQASATRAYILAFIYVILASFGLVALMGFDGAVWAYFTVMAVLLLLLLVQYLRLRISSKS